MLYRNDIFTLESGGKREQFRLLHSDPEAQVAWAISMDAHDAWPVAMDIGSLAGLKATPVETSEGSQAASLAPSKAMLDARDRALKHLGDIWKQVPDIFDPRLRSWLVNKQSSATGASRPTLYKLLRRWWRGGQTPAALLPAFKQCGSTVLSAGTKNRGAKSKYGSDTHQLAKADMQAFDDAIKTVYLKDERASIAHAYQRLLERHYQFADGNGDHYIRPMGERPTFRQFHYYLSKNYSLEHRLRARKGNKDFERENRAILGDVLADCRGVGHYYEADATIADVYLVAKSDPDSIVGKPTIYFITDRKSRLIVGWYVGLENASWVCAMQAIMTISQDKRELCERYGIKYEPTDWPAHEVFPSEFLADRGEMFTRASSQIADELGVTVTNVPSKRGDWKPIAENGFKLLRTALQPVTPGFDPPENAKRRQGKHYERDACLTLDEFTKIILLQIITHNRSPIRGYEVSLKELADKVEPSPISIWNHNVVTQAGFLPRFRLDDVRMALLPRGEGTVTEDGVLFGGCLYTCPEAISGGWFVKARTGRFKVTVSHDRRLVDTIYVHDSAGRKEPFECTLTTRSQKYEGLSFAEVQALQYFAKRMERAAEQTRIQTRSNFHSKVDEVTRLAKDRRAKLGIKKSRSARRADTKEARQDELRQERQELAGTAKAVPDKPSATVLSMSARRVGPNKDAVVAASSPKSGGSISSIGSKTSGPAVAPEETRESARPTGNRIADLLRMQKEKMKNG